MTGRAFVGVDLDAVDLDAVDLEGLARAHGVVGAALGVGVRGERRIRSVGSTRSTGGVPVTADTRFLLGSLTKALVATAVVASAVDGALDLDAPVVEHVGGVPPGITTRHLLDHTSGLPDAWPADGDESDEALARFVGALPPLHALPGARFGYSNAGYAVLGRLLEVVERAPFKTVLGAQVLEPLGLTGASFDLAAVVCARFAVGHERIGDGRNVPVERIWGARSMAAAGSRLWATVDDLLRFGEAHAGLGPAVPADVRATMHRPSRVIPDHRHGRSMGLGVVLDDRWGHPVVLHDGGALGQSAYLRIAPDPGVVLALVCTGGVPQRFHRAVFTAVTSRLDGLEQPPDVVPDPHRRVDQARYEGRYGSALFDVEVRRGPHGLEVSLLAANGPATAWSELQPVDDELFLVELGGRPYSIVFGFGPDGRADRILAGMRLLGRVGPVGAT